MARPIPAALWAELRREGLLEPGRAGPAEAEGHQPGSVGRSPSITLPADS
jgi:hypothetical protein